LILINEKISIFDDKIRFKAIRSTGPGGQHVNKVSTAIVLKYDISDHDYPEWFLINLKRNISSQQLSNNEKIIIIKSQRFRSQLRNKEEAVRRLIKIFKKSSIKNKTRRMTFPTRISKEKRLNNKKNQSKKKNLRKTPNIDD